MKGWLVGSLKLWIESIIQVRRILKRELSMPCTMTEMKIRRNRLAFGVIFVGFLVVLAIFFSCPGVSCSKAAKFSIKHFAKSKETATAVNVAATSSLNKTKTSDKNKNAVKAQTEATSRTNSSWKGGFAPVDDADFEPDDYRSSDPTPSLKQPPHKLVPSR